MSWACSESEGNDSKHHRGGGTLGGKITRKASKKVVERCKGVDMAELELVEEKARGPCGLDKACQLCFNDGFD